MLVMGVPKHLLRQINKCPNLCVRTDCDGHKQGYCVYAGECSSKIVKVDCDGDKVAFCKEW